jgi:CHAT domain-containing protein
VYSVGALNDANSVVFTITADKLDAVVLNATGDQIAGQVKTFSTDRRANSDTLTKLYELVISSVIDKLKTKHQIVVPDGALQYVPFAALRAPTGRYVIDDFGISIVPSATALVLLKERKAESTATSPGLVLAQPSAPRQRAYRGYQRGAGSRR